MDKNSQVQAIISPQTSPETELFAGTAERSNIPFISSSAAWPASSWAKSRFFVRTAPSMSSQARPIAAILEAFAWRAAILLHEDSPYGIGILSSLVHAFKGSRSLTDSVAVPGDATDSLIDAALLVANTMPTRVYIVHMLPALAARLFRRAMVAGMISEGYVWIATAGVGDAVDSLPDHGDINNMQGVVSLLPYVQATEELRSFRRRFRVRFRLENSALQDDDLNVPMSLLWLYDTAWAAAVAAEVSFRTAPPTTFLDALLVSKFDGLTGRFRLVGGQLRVSTYEIVNIIGKGVRTVRFWTPEFGISTSLYPKSPGKELKQILWPGETAVVPIGWTATPNGRPLIVAVSVSGGPSRGYYLEVFEAVMARLNYALAYKYILVSNASMEFLLNMVHDKEVDAVAGHVTITASRMNLVSFTMPFAETGYSMIVAEEDISNSMWIFVKPLTPELWLTSLAFFLFTGFLVWEIEHRINPRFSGTPLKQFGTLLYFAFSTMVFSHKEKLESNLSKLVVIMWVFVVLILTTSYTANLASMLTVRQLQPSMNDWTEKDYVGIQEGSSVELILEKMGFPEAKFRMYTTIDQYADALNKGSDNGGVTAIFDEVPYLKLFLSRYCEGYSMVGPIYKSGGFGFVFPLGSPLVEDVSRAILELKEEGELTLIENKWFNPFGACVSRSKGVEARLGLWRLGGLFLTNAVVSGIVLLVHLASLFSGKPRADSEGAVGALQWLRAWLRLFNTSEERRGEPGNNGRGDMELNHHGLAAGATEQQGDTGDSDSTPLYASDSGRNAASAPVPEEILAHDGDDAIISPQI
ncbi:glutamate receptor 2.7-like [Lolium perenne]|uniref:glutamate receptor 2.7-like n=1 Tax=Lolium perenne TaxID=4522 RepID=UPI003A9969CD